MSEVDNEIVTEQDEHVINYVKSLAAIEEAMEPFKEQKRALKNNYMENGWMSREDISLAVKAFRMIQKNTDPERLMDYYNTVSKTLR
jgi:hypothetical protein